MPKTPHVGGRGRRAPLLIALLASCLAAASLPACPSAATLPDPGADPHSTSARDKQRIREMLVGMKDVPLPVIIEALTEHRVLPWRGEAGETLLALARRIEALIETTVIEASRMNEVGHKVENVVLEAMHGLQLEARRPAGASGRARSTGYPDIESEIGGTAFYIEVKTFSAATVDSTQRSFYLSPSTDFKVTRDAIHLLVAVELSASSTGAYRARSVRWLDLSGLRCDLKYEFNASNRDLYSRTSGLVILEEGGAASVQAEEASIAPKVSSTPAAHDH